MTTVLPVEPADWRTQAVCRDHDPEIWHPVVAETGNGPTQAAMKALVICAACPVSSACRDDAIRLGDQHGIWGGMVPSERARLAAEQRQYVGAHREPEPDPEPEPVPDLGPVVESSRHRTLRELRDAGQPVESIAAYFGGVQPRTVRKWLSQLATADRMRQQLVGSDR